MKIMKSYGETALILVTVVVAFYATIELMGLYKQVAAVTVIEYDGFEFDVTPMAIETENSVFVPVESILRFEGYEKISESKKTLEYTDYNKTKLILDFNAEKIYKNDFSYNSKSQMFIEEDILYMDIFLLSKIVGKNISFADNRLVFSEFQFKPYEWIKISNGYIAKSCGVIRGIRGTNSYDALVNSYNAGHRVFGVNLAYSIDGYLVCADTGQPDKSHIEMNLEEFKKGKAEGLVTMSFEDLIKLMHLNKDIFVVMDTGSLELNSGRFYGDLYQTVIKYDAQILKRIIPQVVSVEDYKFLKNTYNFENMIFNFEKIILNTNGADMEANIENDIEEYILSIMTDNSIPVAVLPNQKINENFISSLSENGKKVFASSVNSAAAASMLKEMGIEGFFTDILYP